MTTERRLVFAGNEGNKIILKGEVIFDQITNAQLASLWCLLNPTSLFESFNVEGPDAPVVRLGGGKPLGFGSVAPRIISYQIYKSADRYSDRSTELDDSKGAFPGSSDERWRSFIDALEERIIFDGDRKKLVDNIKVLDRLMDLEGLGDAAGLVSYPPNAAWEQYGTKKFP